EGLDVVAHQVELMDIVLVGGMHGHLGWRQAEDQPATADIDVRQLEHVTQECAIRVRLGAVDDRMGTDNHEPFLLRRTLGGRRRTTRISCRAGCMNSKARKGAMPARSTASAGSAGPRPTA